MLSGQVLHQLMAECLLSMCEAFGLVPSHRKDELSVSHLKLKACRAGLTLWVKCLLLNIMSGVKICTTHRSQPGSHTCNPSTERWGQAEPQNYAVTQSSEL